MIQVKLHVTVMVLPLDVNLHIILLARLITRSKIRDFQFTPVHCSSPNHTIRHLIKAFMLACSFKFQKTK